jgi:hypothetical protein
VGLRRVERCGIPLKPKPGLTPISRHAVLERSACAPFIKERRMECLDATSLRRKSGQMGHPAFVAGEAGSIESLLSRLLAYCLQQGELNASGLGLLFSDLQPALRLRFDNVQVAALFCDPDLA